ncbi:MAG: hypothetical protein IKD31_05795 [Clostridia bacterium]|nr:hypothetical protein [Clostridia bacterium]
MADQEMNASQEQKEIVTEANPVGAPSAENGKKKKSGKALPLILGSVGVGLVALIFGVALIFTGLTKSAYNAGEYKKAYENSALAFVMAKEDKMLVTQYYIERVLCREQGEYYKAAKFLEETDIPAETREKMFRRNPLLAMCFKGNIATYGELYAQDVDWVVLDVVEENGRARAFLLSKDVLGNSNGWKKEKSRITYYESSDLHSWCGFDFLNPFKMSLEDPSRLLEVTVSTADASDGSDSGPDFKAIAYAPSKEELQTYLTGDLEKYLKASGTATAEKSGVLCRGKENYAAYFTRNIGILSSTDQTWKASGVTLDGVITEEISVASLITGTRVCINVDLGPVE